MHAAAGDSGDKRAQTQQAHLMVLSRDPLSSTWPTASRHSTLPL
jgi:hypothetical protein